MSDLTIVHCRGCQATIPPRARFCPACAAPVSGLQSHADALPTQLDSGSTGATPSIHPAGHSALVPGATLDGKYEIRGRLGAGGFGEVYKVFHTILKRDFALKTLHPLLVHHAQIRERFFREARVLMDLSHPNIVTIRDVGDSSGTLYLVMDFCPGETLQAMLKRRGRLPAGTVASLALPVLRALDYAHAKGVVHRDLKPANVMILPVAATGDVTGTTDIKVLDFGVAKVVREDSAADPEAAPLTGTGMAIGTLHYMSPEQASGDRPGGTGVDARADLYSLGVMLFEAVTGKRPFDGDNPTQIYKKILLDPPPNFTSLGVKDDLPGFEALLRRCLAKELKDRPASARALIAEIEGLLNGRSHLPTAAGRPVSAMAPTERAIVSPAAARPRSVTTFAALGLVALIGIVGVVGTKRGWFGRGKGAPRTGTSPENAQPPANDAPSDPGPTSASVPANAPANTPVNAPPTMPANVPAQVPANVPANTTSSPSRDPEPDEVEAAPGIPPTTAATVLTHPDRILGIGFSPDGKHLVTGGQDAHLRVWDATGGKLGRTLRGHDAEVRGVLYGRKGNHLISVSADGTARMWDLDSGREVRKTAGHKGAILAVSVAFDSERMATAGADTTVRIWRSQPQRQEELLTYHSAPVVGVDFSPEGNFLASVDEKGIVKIWNLAQNTPMRSPLTAPAGHSCIQFLSTSRAFATGGQDGRVRIWKLPLGAIQQTLHGHTGPVRALAYHDGAALLASAGDDGAILLWDIKTWRHAATFQGHTAIVRAVTFSADGKRLASASDDKSVRIWSIGR